MFPVANNQSHIQIDMEFSYPSIPLNEEKLKYRYTHGHCGVLATVIHQLTGWPVYGIQYYSSAHCSWSSFLIEAQKRSDFNPFSFTVNEGWSMPVHAVVRNPKTGRYIDAYGFNQTWSQINKVYREYQKESNQFYKGTGVRIKKMEKIDLFRRMNEDYTLCLKEHVAFLLPELAEIVGRALQTSTQDRDLKKTLDTALDAVLV